MGEAATTPLTGERASAYTGYLAHGARLVAELASVSRSAGRTAVFAVSPPPYVRGHR